MEIKFHVFINAFLKKIHVLSCIQHTFFQKKKNQTSCTQTCIFIQMKKKSKIHMHLIKKFHALKHASSKG